MKHWALENDQLIGAECRFHSFHSKSVAETYHFIYIKHLWLVELNQIEWEENV